MSAQKTYKVEIVWRNVALMAILHISAIYGLYLYAAKAQIKTIIAVVLFKLLSGWLLCRKHPDVIKKGKTMDMSDIWADPVVRFQRRFYFPMITLFCFLLPALIPYYYWSENFWVAFFTCSMYRYCFILHMTWLVNSAAHLLGGHPYNKNIKPSENIGVTLGSLGEGYHNYHHTFPYDYSTSEHGWKYNFNFTTLFIDSFAAIGWAYDRKKVPPEVVFKRQERTGEFLDISKRTKEGFTKWDWIINIFIMLSSYFAVPLLTRSLLIT